LKTDESANYWYVYIIEASDSRLYTGITLNIARRWKEHQNHKKGAKFFRGRYPRTLLFLAEYPDRASASREEYRIKQLTRLQKQQLIESTDNQVMQLTLTK